MKAIFVMAAALAAGAAAASASGADYNGDGTDDVAVWRPSNGLWSVRGISRIYYGTWNDEPAAGDYDGDGTDEAAIYRATTGLWAVRGMTKVYYGTAGDIPAGNSDGDWYRSGTDLCALAAGNIGIGVGNPAYKIDVVGDRIRLRWSTQSTAETINVRTDGAAGIAEIDTDNADLWLKSNSGDLVMQGFGGNVGIGVADPFYPLEIAGGAIMLEGQTTAPTTSSWEAGIYALGTSNTELWALDGQGNTTQLSPHDPGSGKWIFFSKNIQTGRVLRIEMEELIFDLAREMSRRTGKSYISEYRE
ncbi:MAG TPA: VCBS repeat-containing protein [bacterium]|nr:VCBS repeat-containing protein [bacterium]